jgi:hypothetical protein
MLQTSLLVYQPDTIGVHDQYYTRFETEAVHHRRLRILTTVFYSQDGVAEHEEPTGYILRTMNTIDSVDDEKHRPQGDFKDNLKRRSAQNEWQSR